ncbi:NAD(P)/FAD-dependent oxidoreductase [Cytobacillus spongiae]|uniref:NAD(P)/FAD-dependent oxidoreductase n=1 Tax=Cytobacillus spongiae TaxID=2901381 RepID=UPI001F31FA9A|nr:NAD(P)/FAD-dependent oxidoreductase [Cytobacillus spongiae]UII55657.1 NAD(P)/FAD-dependent oxidoreductase [Cytobacillus spongiae]
MNKDVLIIGGGPAGLSAAVELATRNVSVAIVDEALELGGKLRQQTQILTSLPVPSESLRGFELADKLINEVSNLPVHQLLGHRVIGFYENGSVGITDEQNVIPVSAKNIIVATGAYEKAIPFLKWTLPGIMTIGAAQTLINKDFVIPGREAVVVGISDFSLDVVKQLKSVGVHIKAMIQPKGQVQKYSSEKLEKAQSLGIQFYQQAEVLEAKGNGKVEELVIEHEGQQLSFQVEFVCIDGGRSPILDVFYQLDCSFGYSEALGGWVPQYDSNFHTSTQNVFLAGNAAGVSRQDVLLLTGKLAGVSVCENLQVLGNQEANSIKNVIWKEIETVESNYLPDVWKARKIHIEHFLQPMLKDQFIS